MTVHFDDRREAGRRLANALDRWSHQDVVVLGLARGGMPVASEVATALGAPLDVLVVRKVGAPVNPEFGIGAVGENDVVWLDDDVLARLGLDRSDVANAVERERADLERRVARYRGDRSAVPIEGRTAIVVDDGLATGVSATAAVQVARESGASPVVVAVPVGAPPSVEALRDHADEVVCLDAPAAFRAVSTFYGEFGQTTDDQVVDLLRRAG